LSEICFKFIQTKDKFLYLIFEFIFKNMGQIYFIEKFVNFKDFFPK